MTRSEKIAANKIDKRVERAYYANCAGIQINMMDIGKVFAFGKLKIAAGQDDAELGASILAFVQTIAKN